MTSARAGRQATARAAARRGDGILAAALAACVGAAGISPRLAPRELPSPILLQDGFESGTVSPPGIALGVLVSYVHDAAACHSGEWCGKQTLGPEDEEKRVQWMYEKPYPLQAYYAAWWKFPPDWRWNAARNDMKLVILDAWPTRVYLNARAVSPVEARLAVYNNRGPDAFFYFNEAGREPSLRADGLWHELQIYSDQIGDVVKVWLDGQPVISLEKRFQIGRTPYRDIQFGAYVNGAAAAADGGPRSFYLDDICISTQPCPRPAGSAPATPAALPCQRGGARQSH